MAGSIETKTISASNLKLKLKLTEAELGNKSGNSVGGHRELLHIFKIKDQKQNPREEGMMGCLQG